MDAIQGAEYVKTIESIAPTSMSKAMFAFVRAAARAANRSRPIENRPEVLKFRFAPSEREEQTPAQKRFAAYVMASDPYMQPESWGL